MAATTLSYKALRQRIAATLEALEGWRESRWAFEQFGRHTDSYAEQAFAIGMPTSTGDSTEPQHSRRLDRGALTTTQLLVSFTSRLRPKDQVTSTDEALDAEDQARAAVLGASRLEGLHLRWVRSDREMSQDGHWRVTTITFDALHRVALE